MAAFRELVSEVDESGDRDKAAMFADALSKQQKMLMEVGLVYLHFKDVEHITRLFRSMVSGGELLYSGVPSGVMSEPRSVTRRYLADVL